MGRVAEFGPGHAQVPACGSTPRSRPWAKRWRTFSPGSGPRGGC